MKIFKNITNGYRKIASGIAIVAFLALLYFALIPAGSMASVISTMGLPIPNAIIKLVDYPQYNTTSSNVLGHEGEYSMPNVPIGTYNISAWAPGYAKNTTTVTVVASPPNSLRDFTLSPNANMVGIGWISSYNTGGTITSTMASQLPRPSDIGTEFLGQYDSRKETAGWFTAILVSDIYGTGATLTIKYYQDDGTPYGSPVIGTVPVNGTFTLQPGDSGLLLGKVIINSTNPVVAEKRIVSFAPGTWISRGIMSILMPQKNSAATEFFGQYDSRKETAGWFTAILISDVQGTGATLTINYYNDDGTPYGSPVSALVPANGTFTLQPGDSGLLLGKVKIKSTNPVIAEKRIVYFTPGTWNAYDLMSDSMMKQSDASKEFIAPIYDGRTDSLGWYSVILISDLYGTGANVKLEYLNLDGTSYGSPVSAIVPVNGTLTVVPGNSGLSYGKLLIHSDNLVVGEERIVNFVPGTWNNRAIMAFNLLKDTDAVKDLVVPQYDSRGEWDAQVVVSAVNGASSPVLNYFNGAGTLDHKEYDIPVNGSYVFYPGNVTAGRLEVGKVTVNG